MPIDKQDPSWRLPYSLESFVIEALRRWKDPELGWAGEVTLVFPGSGGQISHLREERRTLFDVSSGYGWERVGFGFKKVTYQHGKSHMLVESRVVRPERGESCAELSDGLGQRLERGDGEGSDVSDASDGCSPVDGSRMAAGRGGGRV